MYRLNLLLILILLYSPFAIGQKRSKEERRVIHNFDSNFVVGTDFGFNSAPFSIRYPFSTISRIKYRHNYNGVVGFGFSYKWLSLRIGITLPFTFRSTKEFGRSKYFNLGGDFSLKQMYFDGSINIYTGYSLLNAKNWNTEAQSKNEIRSDISSIGIRLHTWYFTNPTIKMSAIRGKTSNYVKNTNSLYVKSSFLIQGISGDKSIFPKELIDSSKTNTLLRGTNSIDIVGIPGYVLVRRMGNWQLTVMTGIGFALQIKNFDYQTHTRSYLGLSPRYDFLTSLGYNKEKNYLMLIALTDNSSIRLNDLIYSQSFNAIKLAYGHRFSGKRIRKALPWL